MEFERGGPGGGEPAASLIEISRVLEETARIVREHAERIAPPAAPPPPGALAQEVRSALAVRRLRRECLGHHLSEAGWAMMLELYLAQVEGRLVYQTQLGVLAGVPQTTALATIRRMAGEGVFVIDHHPQDRRLLIIRLADASADRLIRYLAAARRLSPLLA
jgi:DNA-binding MarR family transcriptional regulator